MCVSLCMRYVSLLWDPNPSAHAWCWQPCPGAVCGAGFLAHTCRLDMSRPFPGSRSAGLSFREMENEPVLLLMGLKLLAALRGLLPPGSCVATGLIGWRAGCPQDSVQTGVCVVRSSEKSSRQAVCWGTSVRGRQTSGRLALGGHQGSNEWERNRPLSYVSSLFTVFSFLMTSR